MTKNGSKTIKRFYDQERLKNISRGKRPYNFFAEVVWATLAEENHLLIILC